MFLNNFRGKLGRGIGSPWLNKTLFSPAVLFAFGEPGVWYDPSQAANLDWRRNLLTWSEDFSNAAWAKTRASVTANATIAPDGQTTADKLVEDTTATSDHFATQVFTGTTATHTYSVYAKAAERSQIRLRLFNGTTFVTSVYFDLAAGTAGAGGTIQDVGSGWYRCSISGTLASSAGCQARVSTAVASSDSYTGNGTSGVYLWGAQLELGSTATEYQPITDLNTEVMERFPQATLFQDTAGTIPVTTAGQTVGLMLDKSKGLVLGSERLVNGDFSSGSTGWTIAAPATNTITISGGAVRFVTNGSADTALLSQSWSGATAVGKTYRITFDVLAGSTGTLKITTLGVNTTIGEHTFTATPGSKSFTLISSNVSTVGISRVVGQSADATIDNISIRELAGNHATQATAASRPTYGIVPFGGRRNLLTWSEDFSNAAWTKQATGTGVLPVVTANAVVAPDGTTTAEQIVFNKGAGTTVNDQSNIRQIVSTTSVTSHSIWLRADAPVIIVMRNPLNNGTYFQVDVTTAWQRFIFTDPNTPASASVFEFGLRANVGVSVPNTATVYAWGAQLELGSTATAYQRVTTQYDVTEAGVPPVAYLAFDGVDDGMVTPTITPNIDKVQVFAGLRKLSDAAQGILLESSTNVVDGGISVFVPSASATAGYRYTSRGTLTANAIVSSGYAAPITNVLTGLGDISGDLATLRVDGTQAATSTADQGTGNYLAYPLYIGRRAGTSLPFNGQLYSLVTRFGDNLSDNAITSIETYVASKTGVTL